MRLTLLGRCPRSAIVVRQLRDNDHPGTTPVWVMRICHTLSRTGHQTPTPLAPPPPNVDGMTESTTAILDTPRAVRDGHRERLLRAATFVLAVLLLPVAALRAPGRARYLACHWALGLRFPSENLDGLTPGTRRAITEARAVAFWRDGQLIGVTSGYRDAEEQFRLYTAEVRRTGSVTAARRRVLPPEESSHVRGTALDIRPYAGARWLERHGADFDLYRTYDNEWWHFEYLPNNHGRPRLHRAHRDAQLHHPA
jgi:zinc D-Ala-D-Ala carboxypeptidase